MSNARYVDLFMKLISTKNKIKKINPFSKTLEEQSMRKKLLHFSKHVLLLVQLYY